MGFWLRGFFAESVDLGGEAGCVNFFAEVVDFLRCVFLRD